MPGQETSAALLCQVYEMQMPTKGIGTLQLVGMMHDVQNLSAWHGIVQQVRSLHTCWMRLPTFVQLSVGI